ncbi:MBL fold metallo-hydrolase [Flammeovirga pectinis]|uniref:MBL fold metallo-hydrolase n=2 Tax=Flammeovirga pectinis TaxID=2494373 RepID=A0A3Q9FLU3_9BACT|nr:MBL fold metallo-hydrolase [Flammeovirga pectinis]
MINLQRLNMDNSWFIEFDTIKLLVDPWLQGTEIDFFSWFNMQWHRTPPLAFDNLPSYDAVLITQKYPDHFHKETLLKLQPKVIIGPRSIAKDVQKILPQTAFLPLDKKVNKITLKEVDIHFLPTRRAIDPIYDCFVLDDGNESVYFATHGFSLDQKHKEQLEEVSDCKLLITPFNLYKLPFFLGGVVSPGIEGVKTLFDQIQPKVIVPTHDEDKHAKGLVTFFAKVVRAVPTDQLKTLPWLSSTYQPLDHYKLTRIS